MEAAVFQSSLNFDVYSLESQGTQKYLGNTQQKPEGVELPAAGIWLVSPRLYPPSAEGYAPFAVEMRKQSVPGLNLSERDLSLKDMAPFLSLTHLRYLSLKANHNGITSEVWSAISVFRDLRWLDVSMTRAGAGSDLHDLRRLSHLRYLSLYGTGLTAAALESVASLKELQALDLGDNPIERIDAHLEELAGLERLAYLSLARTDVSDAGTTPLAQFKSLQALVFFDTKITSESYPALARMSELTNLDLSRTLVDSKGLSALKALRRLTLLDLRETRTTAAGVLLSGIRRKDLKILQSNKRLKDALVFGFPSDMP